MNTLNCHIVKGPAKVIRKTIANADVQAARQRFRGILTLCDKWPNERTKRIRRCWDVWNQNGRVGASSNLQTDWLQQTLSWSKWRSVVFKSQQHELEDKQTQLVLLHQTLHQKLQHKYVQQRLQYIKCALRSAIRIGQSASSHGRVGYGSGSCSLAWYIFFVAYKC